MNKVVILFSSILIIGLNACNTSPSGPVIKESGDGEKVYYYEGEQDKVMNAAIEQAKASFSNFEKAFEENRKSKKYIDFSVKQSFPVKAGGNEHMWITNIEYDGKAYYGTLANTPLEDVGFQMGDEITIDKNMISDWMYTDKSTNKTYGAYTLKVMRDSMTDVEKAAFDEEAGYDFVD